MMDALVYNRETAKLSLKEVDVPVCGEEDVLIKVEAVGICGGDLHFYTGGFRGPGEQTGEFVTGHEFAGVVAQVGARAPGGWKVGDRVVTDNTGGACGVCPACARGHFVNCPEREVIGLSMDGGFASYVRIPGSILHLHPNCMFHLPENVDFPGGTVLEPAANAYRTVFQEGRLKAGECVVIYGPGPIGLMCVQMARLGGASEIILVGQKISRGPRAEIGRAYGATHWLESDSGQDIEAEIAKIAGKDGVDLVIDAVGHPSILPQALRMVRNEGTVIRVGLNERPVTEDINLLTVKAIRLLGHMGYDTECWRNCLRLAAHGTLDLNTIITHTLPLSQWEDGMKWSIDNTAAKVVLIP